MGDELRGENLVHLNVRFSTETELKKIQDFLYEKSGQGVSFTGLVEAMANEVTIVTAVHNIKSNKGSRTAGVDKIKMDKYLQMPKDELILLIQSSFRNYRPKPARREYIEKSNGKKRPLGIPTVLDRIIQECVRIIIEPICEARFYPQSYGFRPYRAQKHAIRGIINVINAGCKSPDQPVWAIEGDIKGCFDNINHRLLLQKLWRIGIHDKRVLKIISQMLKAGYMENDLFHATELGTPQGGILSPLLSNVYLNDFDWYVGRMYMEPHRQCKHKGNDTRRLKWAGVTPKYNYRYADDWVILTSTEKEALRLKRVLTKYFRNRMKLELSQEKTYVTDLRTNGIHFLGFVVKAERKRKTPDPATWTKHLVGKPLPDMERLGKKIKKLLEEVHRIELCQKVNVQAAQIQYVNSVIMGMAQYLQTSICSHAYHAIDRRVNNAALTVWKKLYPKRYNSMQVPLKVLCNLPDRHKGYDSKTFAVSIDGKKVLVQADRAKTKSSLRTLPLVPHIRDRLLMLKGQQDTYRRLCGKSYNREYLGYLCVDEIGNIIRPNYVSEQFPKLLEKNGLRPIRFHDLRHSCASLLLANGVPMKQIQEWLGHSDFSTTANIYVHLDYASKLSSAQAMLEGLGYGNASA